MRGIGSIASRSSAYLFGAVTGLVVALPLVAVAFSAGAAPQVAAIGPIAAQVGTAGALQSSAVNRTAKGARLEVRMPAAPQGASGGSSFAKSVIPASAIPASAIPAMTSGGDDPAALSGGMQTATAAKPSAPARAMRTPKGCLSAIGVTKSNIATEELTVCVADASAIKNIY